MELQIGIDEFSRALYRAQGIVEKKSTMPILASVLLEATQENGGRLRASAFDLEIGVTGTHPAEVHRPGCRPQELRQRCPGGGSAPHKITGSTSKTRFSSS